jgi:internalin A
VFVFLGSFPNFIGQKLANPSIQQMRIFPLSVLAIAISLFSFTSVQAEASPKTFEQWCQQKNSLSDGAKNTVEVLLKKAKTQDCKVASKKLTSLTSISLESANITDVEPIASLTNLTDLYLNINEIAEISTLSNLTKLTTESFRANKGEDVTPLSKLTSLTYLHLGSNGVSDVSSLASLVKLEFLNLSENPFPSLKPLSSLKSLTYLGLWQTKFKPTDCPVQPISICDF